ncbi:MAG: hypothetical protein R2991_03330 [Thermoanaerobaculia bacterium]
MPIDPQLLAGSLVLSLLHAAIPSHWLPLVLVARTERWTVGETLGATAVAGFAHTLSTVLIGVAVGLFGRGLAERHPDLLRLGMPAVLFLVGVAYLIAEWREHGEHHHDHGVSPDAVEGRSRAGMLLALSLAMFLSPCLEIEAYFFVAGAHGWGGIAAVSSVYTLVTVAGMVLLVRLGLAGLARVDFHWLDHHEKGVVGVTMLGLAVVAYWLA